MSSLPPPESATGLLRIGDFTRACYSKKVVDVLSFVILALREDKFSESIQIGII